jgi:hypothetical protein
MHFAADLNISIRSAYTLRTPVRSFEIFVALFVAEMTSTKCAQLNHIYTVDYLTFRRVSNEGRRAQQHSNAEIWRGGRVR